VARDKNLVAHKPWATDNRALTDHGREFVTIRPRSMGRLEQEFRYPADGGRGITAWRNP
jgi:hypothetical protein